MLDLDQDAKPRYEDALKVAVGRHDISVINIYDERERTLPDVGLIAVKDNETSQLVYVDTSRRAVREQYHQWSNKAHQATMSLLRKYKVDTVSVRTCDDYVKSLVTLFKTRT
jgi:hypothetical protein